MPRPAWRRPEETESDPVTAPWATEIHNAAERFGVPERWICEVIRQESGGHAYSASGRPTTSWTGAIGLMQVMPSTYAILKKRYGLGDDPSDPANNIMAGTAYIREMYERFGAPGFLAAYNAGPGRAAGFAAGISSLPRETLNYLARVAPRLGQAGVTVASRDMPAIGPDSEQPMPPDLINAVLHSGGLGPGWQAIRNTENPTTHGNMEFAAPLLIPASDVSGPLRPVTEAINHVSRADVDTALRKASGAAYAVHLWVGRQNEAVKEKAGELASAAVDGVKNLKPNFAANEPVPEKPVPGAPQQIGDSMDLSDQRVTGMSEIKTVSYETPVPAASDEPTVIAEAPVPLSPNMGRIPGNWTVILGRFADPSLATPAMRRLSKAMGHPFGSLQKLVHAVDKHGVTLYQVDAIGLNVSDATSLCDAMIRRNLDCTALPPGSGS